MTTRVRKVITAVDSKGNAFSEVHTETQVGERWYLDDPTSLASAGPEAEAWIAQYAGLIEAERNQLRIDLTASQSSLVTTEAARDAAVSQVAALQSQVDTIPSLQAQIAELTVEVARLTALVPPPIGPRQIYPRELLGRLTFSEVVAAIRTDDDAAIYAVANLQTTVSPVDLDSEETRTLIGALVIAGILTPERLVEVLS